MALSWPSDDDPIGGPDRIRIRIRLSGKNPDPALLDIVGEQQGCLQTGQAQGSTHPMFRIRSGSRRSGSGSGSSGSTFWHVVSQMKGLGKPVSNLLRFMDFRNWLIRIRKTRFLYFLHLLVSLIKNVCSLIPKHMSTNTFQYQCYATLSAHVDKHFQVPMLGNISHAVESS